MSFDGQVASATLYSDARSASNPSTLAKVAANDRLPPEPPLGGVSKRAFDILFSSVLMLAIAPLLVVVFALIKIGGGDALFAHERIGFGGRRFKCLKFRTMVANADVRLHEHLEANPEAAAEWARDQKLKRDPRVTLVGKFLRKTSLDELPQLFNVLRGEMSLVGPRPVVPDELERYGARKSYYLAARPGLTGLWQTSGRNTTTYERRTELDERYVSNWSLGQDVVLIVKTVGELTAWSKTS